MDCKYLQKETGQCGIGIDLTIGRPDPTEKWLYSEIEKSQKMGLCEREYENCPAYQEWEKRRRIFESK